MSFLQFLGIAPGAGLPASNTVVDFRARCELTRGLGAVFDAVNAQLAAKGLVLRRGAIKVVDVTPIAAQSRPGRRNADGQPLEPQAGYAKRKEQTHFGYKAHVGLDACTGMIHGFEVTAANVHDSQVFTGLVDDGDSAVSADKA